MLMVGGGCVCEGEGGEKSYDETLVSTQFCCELKNALKTQPIN